MQNLHFYSISITDAVMVASVSSCCKHTILVTVFVGGGFNSQVVPLYLLTIAATVLCVFIA